LGIGNNPGEYPDWTLAQNAADYTSKTLQVLVLPVQVVGEHIFYNGSAWDNNDPGPNAGDDDAIAPDKSALHRGGVATFANYTSYSRGINGIMVDIAGLPGNPATGDFTFKVGNDNNPAAWAVAPAPTSVTVRRGAGDNGSDRVTLI